MSSSTVVAFALVMTILGIHVLYACPSSTGMCKQYGHACLGGHGKRAENLQSRLMNYILRKVIHSPQQDRDMTTPDVENMREILQNTLDKKLAGLENNEGTDLDANLYN